MQVLDFQTQQQRLLPQLAAAYATSIASKAVLSVYSSVAADMNKGDLQHLPLVTELFYSGVKSPWKMSSSALDCTQSNITLVTELFCSGVNSPW